MERADRSPRLVTPCDRVRRTGTPGATLVVVGHNGEGLKPTHLSQFGRRRRMSQEGQDDQFPPPKLSARSAFGKQTFAGASGNDEDAP